VLTPPLPSALAPAPLLSTNCTTAPPQYLNNIIRQPELLATYISNMCKPPSSLAFGVCCSHTETSTDSDGNTTTSTVVTHSSEHPLEWSSLIDSSAFAGLDLLALQGAVRQWATADASLLEVDSEMPEPTASDGSLEAEKQRLLMSHRCAATRPCCVRPFRAALTHSSLRPCSVPAP